MMAAIELSKSNPTYVQNFDGTATAEVLAVDEAAIAAADAGKRSVSLAVTLPDGWVVRTSDVGAHNIGVYSSGATGTTYVGGTSLRSDSKRGTWNFGKSQNSDRAIGGITSSSTNGGAAVKCVNVLCQITNTEAEAITSLDLSYAIEQYRKGQKDYKMTLYTSTTGEKNSWTAVDDAFSLIFDNKVASATGAVDDALPISTKSVEAKKLAVNIAADASLYLAWNLAAADGNEQGGAAALALDDVTITANYGEVTPDPEPEPEPATPIASGELFGTDQKNNVYGSDFEGVDYWVVTCGQKMLLRAKTATGNFQGAGWGAQIRIGVTEIWTDGNIGSQHKYTANTQNEHKTFTTKDEELSIHFFSEINGTQRKTDNYSYFRHSINNPIADAVAPVLDVENTTFVDNGDGTITVTFGTVTADDEYFYYVADKDHNLGDISLDNTITLTKPTVQDGITYTLKAYAVDFNGNKSEAKEYSFTMPFDEELNLAENRPSYCGYQQQAGTGAEKANNINLTDFWTCFGGPVADAWWKVDLLDTYDLTYIEMLWNDATGTYSILGSTDDINWASIVSGKAAPASKGGTSTDDITVSARYIKMQFSSSNIGLKNVIIRGTGIAAADHTAPTLSLSEVSKTVTTATIGLEYADLDDNGGAGQIVSIKISDTENGFAEREILSEISDGKITLSGLKDNTTYTFHVVVADKAGNQASKDLEVVLPFNTGLNIAPLGTASADASEAGHKPEDANDKRGDTFWGNYNHNDANIWTLDLKQLYNVYKIVIKTPGIGGNKNIDIEAGYDGENWITVYPQVTIGNDNSDPGYIFDTKSFLARYIRVVGPTDKTIGFTEFEVYATGFGTADTEAPVISAAEASDITYGTAKVTLTATDNVGIISCEVTDGVNHYAKTFDVVDGQFIIDGLETTNGKQRYNFTLRAIDLAGNASEVFYMDEIRTLANPSIDQLASISATTDKVLCSTSETVTITPACKDQHDAEFTTVTYEYNVDAACGAVSEGGIFTPAEDFRGWATISVTATSETDIEEVQSTSVKVYVANDNIALNTAYECNADAISSTDYKLAHLTDGNTSKKWQGSARADGLTEGATRDNLDAWFVLDLKDKYQIGVIVIDFDGASAQSYDIFYSVNGVDYTKAFDRTRNPGAEADDRTDILHANMSQQYFSVDENIPAEARYVKFVCRRSSPWGVRVQEVYVYGTLVADTEKPVITSATVRNESIGEDHVILDVEATDNIGVTHVRVVDEPNGVNVVVALEDNAATVTGLVPGTTYNFSVYARDLQENESEIPAIVAAFQTVANDNVPHTAALVPTIPAARVTSIYSDAYASAVKDGFQWRAYNSTAAYEAKVIAGDNYMHYACGAGGEFAIGADFKDVTKPSTDGQDVGINISTRAALHVDVWSKEAYAQGIGITLNDNRLLLGYKLQAGWNSINVSLAELKDKQDGGFVSAASVLESLKWMKFTEITNKVIAIDNIYFYGVGISETASNNAVMEQYDTQEVDVVLNRGFETGSLYTFCVPFSMDADQIEEAFGADAQVWMMTDSEDRGSLIHIDFALQSNIVAGTPYLLRPSKDFAAGTTIEGVIVSNTQGETLGVGGAIQMHGYINRTTFTGSEGAYFLLADAYLHELQAEATYNGLRAYFTFAADVPVGTRARIRLGETVTTDIETLDGAANIELQKVLKNGNIYIIRDGRMYNVQGQLVK